MKPQIIAGLAVTALYTLSGCTQNTPYHTQQPQKAVSQHVSFAQKKSLTARRSTSQRQRQIAPQRRVAARRYVAPRRAHAARKAYAPRRAYTPRRRVAPQRPQYRPPIRQHRASNGMPRLSAQEIRHIGDQIFANESGSDINKLVHWNVGENFASMGIGHFTWYPAGRRARFGNTFPGMLTYLESRGVRLPQWLQQAKYSGAPWSSRAQLMREKNSPQVQELQRMLYETRYLQAEYIMQRAQRAMPKLVKASPPHLRPLVANNLNAVANSRSGWYPLIDYVNFKGEGINRHGGYRGQNWGLLQVLEEMRPSQPGPQALNEFAAAAMRVLDRRVRNSPPARNERRWLRGWSNRISTYREVI